MSPRQFPPTLRWPRTFARAIAPVLGQGSVLIMAGAMASVMAPGAAGAQTVLTDLPVPVAAPLLAPDPEPAPAPVAVDPPHATPDPAADLFSGQRWAVFGQSTFTTMATLGFHNPYEGDQSVPPRDIRETFDASLYIGLRPWRGGEIWATAEVDQGFGVGDAHGFAGYVSGEAYKLGKAKPYSRIQRLYFRQTIPLGGGSATVEAAPNQLAGTQSEDRLVVTVGKFGVVDVFDANTYAHDPRGDFLNWSLIDAGAFDYAGDPWGFSYGAAVELYKGAWTARIGAFNLTDEPGGMDVTTDFSFLQLVGEIEHRHILAGHRGAIRAALWMNRGRLPSYADAIAWGQANETVPDIYAVQGPRRTRVGGYLNAEQEVTDTLGLFLRASLADGRYAVFDFTDIDRSVSFGLSLKGRHWGREADTVALGFAVNAASSHLRDYLAAGGLGLLIGDGQLPHYGSEAIVEASYTLRPMKQLAITFDAQGVINPAYNRDRGPVPLLAVRLHASF